MNVNYTPKALDKLNAKLAYVSGRGSRKLAQNIAVALDLGNENDRLRGLSRYGQPQAPVKKRTGKYKGKTGPPLAPSGAASRVVTNFRARVKGSRPPYTIAAGWENVVSDKGVPFLPFLDQGVRGKAKGKTAAGRLFHRVKAKLTGTWLIPPRPFFGVSPNTWKLVREQIEEFNAGFKGVR